jgi:ABC-type nickel/cobalt efflux system permease component RcnA
MNDFTTIAAAAFALGVVHSLEPDHLAAMSTLVGRAARPAHEEFRKGAAWSAGHVLALGAFGAALLFLTEGRLPEGGTRLFELAVGALLVYLGFVRLWDARRGALQHHHSHGAVEHSHLHIPPGRSASRSEPRGPHHGHAPLWLGILHGLAGSGGLLVVMPALVTASPTRYFAYVAAFGLGSMLSMGTFCVIVARFAFLLRRRSGRGASYFSIATGSLSICVGAFWLGTAAWA